MDFLEKLPIVSSAFFLFGSFFMIGGIRIIRDKKFWTIGRTPPPHILHMYKLPKLMTGKSAIRSGISYIIYGTLFILLAIALYSGGL